MLNTFNHPSLVPSVALQPGSNGNFLATACADGILRLFDLRRGSETGKFCFYIISGSNRSAVIFNFAISDAMLQSAKICVSLHSTMFSPADPSVIAVAGDDGALLYDLSNLKRSFSFFF